MINDNEKIKEIVKKKIKKTYKKLGKNIETVLLYGSRARGDAKIYSDFDIFVLFNQSYVVDPSIYLEFSYVNKNFIKFIDRICLPNFDFLIYDKKILNSPFSTLTKSFREDLNVEGEIVIGKKAKIRGYSFLEFVNNSNYSYYIKEGISYLAWHLNERRKYIPFLFYWASKKDERFILAISKGLKIKTFTAYSIQIMKDVKIHKERNIIKDIFKETFPTLFKEYEDIENLRILIENSSREEVYRKKQKLIKLFFKAINYRERLIKLICNNFKF